MCVFHLQKKAEEAHRILEGLGPRVELVSCFFFLFFLSPVPVFHSLLLYNILPLVPVCLCVCLPLPLVLSGLISEERWSRSVCVFIHAYVYECVYACISVCVGILSVCVCLCMCVYECVAKACNVS